MALNQQGVDSYRVNLTFNVEVFAKLRQFIRGRQVENKSYGGRAIRKELRQMMPGDIINEMVIDLVKDIKLDKESIAWLAERREMLYRKRRDIDIKVKAGANRKPKSEWKKRGRVAGKDYGDSYAGGKGK